MLKKIYLFSVVLLLLSCATPEEERFVNPVFYETMKPISRTVWETHITPTSKMEISSTGYIETAKCEMLKNTEDTVSLKCIEFNLLTHEMNKDEGVEKRDEYDCRINTFKLTPCKDHWYCDYYGYKYRIKLFTATCGENISGSETLAIK